MLLNAQNLAEGISQLPVFPRLLHNLMDGLKNNSIGLNKIAGMIAADPAIGAKVIKLANSAAYRRAQDVTSIENATLRLGAQPVHSVVVASFLTNAFPALNEVDREQFWTHTFTVASLARSIANLTHVDPSAAFSCATLYNIGDLAILLLCDKLQQNEIKDLMAQGSRKVDAQKQVLEVDYRQIGVTIGNKWQFPPLFIRCIAQHLTPLAHKPPCEEACLISLALEIKTALDKISLQHLQTDEEKATLIRDQIQYKMSENLLKELKLDLDEVIAKVVKAMLHQQEELDALLG